MATHYYLVGVTQPTGSEGLTYASKDDLAIGDIVEVAVRGRKQAGVIIEPVLEPKFETKPITRQLGLKIPTKLVDLGRWLWQYYACEASAAWQTVIPTGALKNRRAIQAAKVKPFKQVPAAKLTQEQAAAVKSIESSKQTTSLLRGVTGSGKTEVYLELATRSLAAGRSAIILTPEIALTPQTEARFQARFGDRVIISHSRLSEAKRFDIWRRVCDSQDPLVVIGPRSALFLPLKAVGLIVLDECHEGSYKQEQAPRYETTVVAAKLARLHEAKLVLGSATPGLREAYLANTGTINKVELTDRYNQLAPAPPIIVDLKDAIQFRRHQIFSGTLLDHLASTLANQRQALIFLNRRGSASSQLCTNCQHVTSCPNCQLPLTFHADHTRMICHICGYNSTPAAVCSNCRQATLRFLGIGTKRVEEELDRLFPNARLARLDRDSLAGTDLDELYDKLKNHEIDILIGTQMIAKGLDLPAMETIGVVLADSSLYLPDYTATERTYALLTQVSGRAGRGQHPGRVIIQTYSPNHPAVTALAHDDYWRFVEQELPERKLLGYPPYSYLLKLSYSHKSDESAQAEGTKLASKLSSNQDIIVMGPAPAFRQYAGGSSHWQIIVKAGRRSHLQAVAATLPLGWTADLDPANLL